MKVQFQEEGHKYFNEDNEEYISVTTLIEKYKEPFDAKFWSEYKAIEKYFNTKDPSGNEFANIKKLVGHKNVNRFFSNYAKPSEKIVVATYQREILMSWDMIRENACLMGADYHAKQELAWKNDLYHRVGGELHFVMPQELIDFDYSQIPDGIYPELVVYSNQYMVAGMADRVLVERPYVDLSDYKTNKKLDRESYYSQRDGRKMMFPPINNLMDCNFMHYQLQLSIYAFLLSLHGLIPRNLTIEHVKRDKNGRLNPNDVETIAVKYLDKEVKLILDYHEQNKGNWIYDSR